jgi:hypothetical protein
MMTPKVNPSAPPIPLNSIYARLVEKLSPRDARCFIRGLSCYPTPTRNSQILALVSIVRDEFQYAWSYAEMGRIFDVSKGIIRCVHFQAMGESGMTQANLRFCSQTKKQR